MPAALGPWEYVTHDGRCLHLVRRFGEHEVSSILPCVSDYGETGYEGKLHCKMVLQSGFNAPVDVSIIGDTLDETMSILDHLARGLGYIPGMIVDPDGIARFRSESESWHATRLAEKMGDA